jgi:hypothetical protein
MSSVLMVGRAEEEEEDVLAAAAPVRAPKPGFRDIMVVVEGV